MPTSSLIRCAIRSRGLAFEKLSSHAADLHAHFLHAGVWFFPTQPQQHGFQPSAGVSCSPRMIDGSVLESYQNLDKRSNWWSLFTPDVALSGVGGCEHI